MKAITWSCRNYLIPYSYCQMLWIITTRPRLSQFQVLMGTFLPARSANTLTSLSNFFRPMPFGTLYAKRLSKSWRLMAQCGVWWEGMRQVLSYNIISVVSESGPCSRAICPQCRGKFVHIIEGEICPHIMVPRFV